MYEWPSKLKEKGSSASQFYGLILVAATKSITQGELELRFVFVSSHAGAQRFTEDSSDGLLRLGFTSKNEQNPTLTYTHACIQI